ncbi:MAG: DUF3667 domain-containing protein [Gemmatimonadetes bacterium]|nr:DUF3667 domain-containing protein [Gemmatimonadota bacterium]
METLADPATTTPGAKAQAAAGLEHRCRNCAAPLVGRFCAQCGQEDEDLDRPFFRLVGDVLGEFFSLDSRVARTIPLLLRPGRLTAEYVSGRRARFVLPVRLYIVSSALFLAAVALTPIEKLRVSVGGLEPADTTAAAAASPAAEAEPKKSLLVGLGPPEANPSRIRAILLRAQENAQSADPLRFRELWFRTWAWSILLLLPVFALVLKAGYRSRPYLHHLIFSLHYHAVFFLAFAFLIALLNIRWGPVAAPLALAVLASIPLYLLLALKRVYGEGWLKTIGKAAGAGSVYLMLLVAFMLGSTVVTALFFL